MQFSDCFDSNRRDAVKPKCPTTSLGQIDDPPLDVGTAIGERDHGELAGAEPADRTVDGVATADAAIAHEIRHRRRVDVGRKVGQRLKRLELGGKRQQPVELRVEFRLLRRAGDRLDVVDERERLVRLPFAAHPFHFADVGGERVLCHGEPHL